MCAAHRRSEARPAPGAERFAGPDAVAPPSRPRRPAGWRDARRVARARRLGVVAGAGVVLDRDVVFDLADGARVELGDGVALGAGSRVHVGPGARVRIGAQTTLGERCVVTALRDVAIGARCLLADEVVVIDAEPNVADVERPIREQGLTAMPVTIGDGVRIGPSAALLRGATVAPGATVAAHTTLRG